MNRFRLRRARPALGGARVLVLEDEYFLADDIASALRSSGAVVLGPVADVKEALALIENEARIDCAVLDINLRGEMSFAVADRLVERGVPFIFGTGYDSGSIPPRYRVVPRWEKPFDPDALALALPASMAVG